MDTGGLKHQVSKNIDFDTINPIAAWEAEKRLFFLPVVDLDDKIEAVDYLVKTRFNLTMPHVYELCSEYIEKGLVAEFDYSNVNLPNMKYINPWYAPWVVYVKVYWDRIVYIIEDPTPEKHIAFRRACTSPNAFSSKQMYEHGPDTPFPVEKLEVLDDVEAVRHEWYKNSPTGTVWLHGDGDKLKTLSIGAHPFWAWPDEPLLISADYDPENPIMLLEKAANDRTREKIDFINGFVVSDKILNFIARNFLGDEGVLIDLSMGRVELTTCNKRLNSDVMSNRIKALSVLIEKIGLFNPDYKLLLYKVLSKNEWLSSSLGLKQQ